MLQASPSHRYLQLLTFRDSKPPKGLTPQHLLQVPEEKVQLLDHTSATKKCKSKQLQDTKSLRVPPSPGRRPKDAQSSLRKGGPSYPISAEFILLPVKLDCP